MTFHVGRTQQAPKRKRAFVLCVASALVTLASAAAAQPNLPGPTTGLGPMDVDLKGFGTSSLSCGQTLQFSFKVQSESGPQDGVLEINGKSFPFTAKKAAQTLTMDVGKLGCFSPMSFTATVRRAGPKNKVLASKTFAPKSIEYAQLLKPFGSGSFLGMAKGACGAPLSGWLASNGLTNQATGTVTIDGEVISVTLTGEGTQVPWTATKPLDCSKSVPTIHVVAKGLEPDGIGQPGIVASGDMLLKKVTY